VNEGEILNWENLPFLGRIAGFEVKWQRLVDAVQFVPKSLP
jgi:hypothetical protein